MFSAWNRSAWERRRKEQVRHAWKKRLHKLTVTGALCGSTYLDEGFHANIEARVRACKPFLETNKEAFVKKQLHRAVRQFRDELKPSFDGASDYSPTWVPFPGLPKDSDNRFEEHELLVER